MTDHKKIEQTFLDRAKRQGWKPKSAKYRNAEVEFFCGAMATIEAIEGQAGLDCCAHWVICLMSGRPIAGQ